MTFNCEEIYFEGKQKNYFYLLYKWLYLIRFNVLSQLEVCILLLYTFSINVLLNFYIILNICKPFYSFEAL